MPRITTEELVNKIFVVCEVYSGVKFFPYQENFAKRIIRSLLDNDGNEITALFSRQCLVKGHKILMGDGTKKNIEKVKIGDKVKCYDFDHFTECEVINSYYAGMLDVYELVLTSGHKIRCTANHRLLDKGSRLYKALADFEAGDEVGYYYNNKVRFSRIKRLRFIGRRPTFDLEVEMAENFICEDILVHNSGKSEVVSTISGGLNIILPVLANLPEFENDPRLQLFKNGLMIGIFAPSLQQAQISFSRMKKRMSSASARRLMSDSEINVSFDVSNGQNIILSNNSLTRCQSASPGSNIEGDSYMLIIVDEAQDVDNLKYLKSISPMGAFYNATKILIGTATTSKGFFYNSIERNKKDILNGGAKNHFEYDYRTVIKYNPRYEKYIKGEKERLGEESDEFQMSYCLKWILERGMFFDPKVFGKMADTSRGLSVFDTERRHVAGIDLGKKSDSTVVTILEVDWDTPVIVESSNDIEIPDYVAYPVYVKAWLELQGDDWNAQYNQIMDFLSNFNLVRVVMDGTGVGDAIYDRMRANLDVDVIPFVFGSQSKSVLYKHLNTECRAGRVHYPADEYTQSTREFNHFKTQCESLEKTYSGQLMVVSHPNERGAHDDYCDSLALAVFGAKWEGVYTPETTGNEFYQKKDAVVLRQRNRYTARRRR